VRGSRATVALSLVRMRTRHTSVVNRHDGSMDGSSMPATTAGCNSQPPKQSGWTAAR
jgi:hypothetical protein